MNSLWDIRIFLGLVPKNHPVYHLSDTTSVFPDLSVCPVRGWTNVWWIYFGQNIFISDNVFILHEVTFSFLSNLWIFWLTTATVRSLCISYGTDKLILLVYFCLLYTCGNTVRPKICCTKTTLMLYQVLLDVLPTTIRRWPQGPTGYCSGYCAPYFRLH